MVPKSGQGIGSAPADCFLKQGASAAHASMASTKLRFPETPPAAAEYPHSDGKIMAESPKHVDAIIYALLTLRNRFAGHCRVQVGADMLLYYQEGDSTKPITPNLFVVRGL